MKFCPVVPEIWWFMVRGKKGEEREELIIIKIIIRNGAKTFSQTLFGRL